MTTEERARLPFDQLLAAAGWEVQDFRAAGATQAEKQGAALKGVRMPVALTKSHDIE